MSERHRSRWIWWLGGLLVLTGVLIWFAPALIAKTSVGQGILSYALPEESGSLAIDSASLGWLSPVHVTGIVFRDAGGEPFLQIAEVLSERSLLELALDQANLGNIRVVGLQLHVVLENKTSNVERSLEPLLRQDSQPSTPPQFALELIDSRVLVTEAETQKTWSVDSINAIVKMLGDTVSDMHLDASARIVYDQRSGRIQARMADGQLVVSTDQLPLEVIQVPAQRFVRDIRAGGTLTANVQCRWRSEPGSKVILASGTVSVDQLVLAAPDFLADDILQLQNFTGQAQLQLDQQRLSVQLITLESDVGRVEASGAMRLSDYSGAGWFASLQDEDISLRGDFDLARIAQLLPSTLHIREGSEIVSGKAHVLLSSARVGKQRQWQGHLETTNLTAVNAGRTVIWQQPILVEFASHFSDDGAVVDRLLCESDFLQIRGQGTLQQANLEVNCDLTRLATQLQQFMDFDRVRMAGNVSAKGGWQAGVDNSIRFRGSVQVDALQLHLPQRRPWEEHRLSISLDALAVSDETQIRELHAATVELVSGEDQLTARLVQPVTEISWASSWPVHVTLRGELATWLPRVQPWIPLDDWDIHGVVSIDAAGHVSTTTTRIQDGKVEVSDLIARFDSLLVHEPVVRLVTAGTWNQRARRWTSEETTLLSSTVSLRADNVSIEMRDGAPPVASGRIVYRADIAGVSGWLRDPDVAPAQQMSGQITGLVDVVHADSTTRADGSAQVKDVVMLVPLHPPLPDTRAANVPVSHASEWRKVWSEPEVTIEGRGQYQHDTDQASLSHFQVASQVFSLSASGKIQHVSGQKGVGGSVAVRDGTVPAATRPHVDLAGYVDYDLEKLTQLLTGYLGEGVKLAGRQRRRFSVRGPLGPAVDVATEPVSAASSVTSAPDRKWLSEWTGQAGLGWESVDLHGLRIGKGQLEAEMTGGVVQMTPLDVAVSSGRIRCTPRILLNCTPALAVIEPGSLVENVQITPQMCATWLKFVAPLMADATRIDGRLSLDVAGAQIPLSQPETGDIEGVVTIHAAQLAPGPLAEPLVALAGQVLAVARRQPLTAIDMSAARISVDDQRIGFRMVDGRVYHRDMTLTVRNVVVRTSGSVGFDQTLDLIAEVPIQDAWINDDKLLASLKGKGIKVPVRGTLSRPQLDRRALADLTGKLLQAPVERAIEDQILKGLNRLFPQQ